jgi:hypothetical protein
VRRGLGGAGPGAGGGGGRRLSAREEGKAAAGAWSLVGEWRAWTRGGGGRALEEAGSAWMTHGGSAAGGSMERGGGLALALVRRGGE